MPAIHKNLSNIRNIPEFFYVLRSEQQDPAEILPYYITRIINELNTPGAEFDLLEGKSAFSIENTHGPQNLGRSAYILTRLIKDRRIRGYCNQEALISVLAGNDWPLVKNFVLRWSLAVIKHLNHGKCNEIDISNYIYSFSELGVIPSEAFYDSWMNAYQKCQFSPDKLNKIASSLNKLELLKDHNVVTRYYASNPYNLSNPVTSYDPSTLTTNNRSFVSRENSRQNNQGRSL